MAEAFPAVERFTERRFLGGGGFGSVYEAYDHKSAETVALKVLHNADPQALLLFKNEFRRVADVVHPNLIRLYDLFERDGLWFFTMGIVEGAPLVKSLRKDGGPDWSLVRDAFLQVARGLRAVHAAGLLHRDLKPPNVLRTTDGRVVILDFGLVSAVKDLTKSSIVAGTPNYMSPEQALGVTLSSASDWYSVGVMLYATLCGRLPFSGPAPSVMVRKLREIPSPPENAPEDLTALCMDLLKVDAKARPDAHEVIDRLGSRSSASAPVSSARSPFVGRETEVARLQLALQRTQEGHSIVAHVYGKSGMGKSALVRDFLRRIGPDTVILAGRCLQQESVPYKALDPVIDALEGYLSRSLAERAAALRPGHAAAISHLFGVLARRWPRDDESLAGDPRAIRRMAAVALRELFGSINAPIVVVIDDAQWGDLDSATILAEILRPPDPPPLLLVASYRVEDIETSPFLVELNELRPRDDEMSEEVVVTALNTSNTIQLARVLDVDEAAAIRIARDSGGMPMFVEALVRSKRKSTGESLNEVLAARIAALPAEALAVLEVVSVAGRPLERTLVCDAANVHERELSTFALLRGERLIRQATHHENETIEAYHDRIREVTTAEMSQPRLQATHATLAKILEASGRAAPEHLVFHLHGAGEDERAAACAIDAGALAEQKLAFERAAELFDLALRLGGRDESALRARYAEALFNTGRASAAGEAFLAAGDTLELRRRAGEAFLISGHVERGVEIMRALANETGVGYPGSPRSALFRLLWNWALGRVGGRFKPRDPKPEDLFKVDLCWSLAMGLMFLDFIVGAYFQTRHFRLAMASGEPGRAARAYALEASFAMTKSGAKREREARELITQARAFAEQVADPRAIGLVELNEGMISFLRGNIVEALDSFDSAAARFLRDCPGATAELNQARLFSVFALVWALRIREAERRSQLYLRDARQRDDKYAVATIGCFTYLASLWDDDVPRARRIIESSRRVFASQPRALMPHFWTLMASCETDIYALEPHLGRARLAENARRLERTLLLRVESLRIGYEAVQALTGIVSMLVGDTDGSEIQKPLKWLERMDHGSARAMATSYRAALEVDRGDRISAIGRLKDAERLWLEFGNEGGAACAARSRGLLMGHDEGHALVEEAEKWFAASRAKDFAKTARLICPGPWDPC